MPSMRQIAALPAILLFLLLLSAVTPAVASEGWGSGTTQGAGDSKPTLGFAVRGGAYGVPDWILDILFEEHPSVDGTMVGVEIRHFGKGGPSGIFSIALTLDAGSTDGFGIWREGTGDPRVIGGGAVDLVAGTVTAYWDIKPSSTLHPYFGLGLGLGYAEGTYDRDLSCGARKSRSIFSSAAIIFSELPKSPVKVVLPMKIVSWGAHA